MANFKVTSISWHPSKRVLAVGWENGELFLYSEQNNTCVEVIRPSRKSCCLNLILFKVPTIHHAAIVILEWSQAGSRLISGDSAGKKGKSKRQK